MDIQAELMIQAAEQLKSEIIAYRRALHQQPEVGAYLPNTKEFVKKALSEMGYAPIEICESGIVATITGKNTGRCILLRADMDALAIKEQTDLPFAQKTARCMHAATICIPQCCSELPDCSKHINPNSRELLNWCSNRMRKALPAQRPCLTQAF